MGPDAATPGLGDPRRWGVFLAGLACLILGIACSITAGLGVGSWQVLETGLVAVTGLPFGAVVLAESVAALALAWWWLGQRPWIATLVLAFAGVGIGAALDAMARPEGLPGQLALLTLGIVLLAVGVAFYLAADLGASAQDALFVGMYSRYGWRPGRVRFLLDLTLVVVGVLLGGQLGLGTLLVTVGVPLAIEPAMRVGHLLAGTPLPAAMQRARRAGVVEGAPDEAGSPL